MMAAIKRSYYFYVLYCRDRTLYAGYTVDLKQRLSVHNAGRGAKYTRPQGRRPLKMIYAERWGTKSLAMQAEAAFKRLARPQKEAYLRYMGQERLEDGNLVVVNRTHLETVPAMDLVMEE